MKGIQHNANLSMPVVTVQRLGLTFPTPKHPYNGIHAGCWRRLCYIYKEASIGSPYTSNEDLRNTEAQLLPPSDRN